MIFLFWNPTLKLFPHFMAQHISFDSKHTPPSRHNDTHIKLTLICCVNVCLWLSSPKLRSKYSFWMLFPPIFIPTFPQSLLNPQEKCRMSEGSAACGRGRQALCCQAANIHPATHETFKYFFHLSFDFDSDLSWVWILVVIFLSCAYVPREVVNGGVCEVVTGSCPKFPPEVVRGSCLAKVVLCFSV